MASTEGGMEIEEVAAKTPEKILKEAINPAVGWQDSSLAGWVSSSASTASRCAN